MRLSLCLSVDFITDYYFIVLTPLVLAGLLVATGFARAARNPKKRNDIAYIHGSLLLLLSFLVLPATSMKIFRLLSPCFKLKTNNTWLHYADLAVNCNSARFLNAYTLGVIMIFIYPVGIPLGYACLLFKFRRLINPPGCSDELQAMRMRRSLQSTHPELRAIDFLFSCYRPGAFAFEVFDSARRIAMTGLIRFAAKTSGPPIAGILLSLVSVIVFREVQPYENPSTNALSTFGQWQLLSTYLLAYALLVELRVADESKLVLIGTLLLLANLATLFLALYLQVGEGDRRVQLNLTLAENEMRETELLHEQEQMKADIEELLSKYGLKLDVSASIVESAGPVSKAAKMQEELFLQAVKECNDLPSFTKRSHPCWVMSVTRLQAFDALPIHEDVIDKLEELLPDSTSPSCAYSFFISQNWEGGKPGTQSARQLSSTDRSLRHPDNSQNTKLRWLKSITQHMRLPRGREVFIWFDVFSIPQHSRDLQNLAVGSLCCYTQLCTR